MEHALSTDDLLSLPALAELAKLDQWVCWRLERRPGEAEPTKVPYTPGKYSKARANDPATWRSFALARVSPGRWDGVGFEVHADDPYAGIDLDHCRDAETGQVQAWARQIVQALGSYTEITPSQAGLRIFLRADKAQLPATGRKRGNVEMYWERHFLTVTGRHLDGTPTTIESRTAELIEVHAQHIAQTKPVELPTAGRLVAKAKPPTHPPVSDEELLRRMFDAKNGSDVKRLWDGDSSGYGGDESSRDLALVGSLAYWTDNDAARIDRLFRRSLCMRPKWDERHAADGRTYGQLTVDRVLASRANGAAPAADVPPAATGNVLHDFADLLAEDLPEPKHPVPGLIQQGLMILAGKPKVGKSYLILNVCLAVAAGALALAKIECPQQAVWYLALEDTKRRLQSRGRQMLAGAEWPRGRFFYDTSFAKLDAGGLEKLDEKLTAHPDIRLVVIDVWKRVKPKVPKGENAYDVDYSHAVLLKTLADKHGIAIVVIHHLNKLVTDEDVDSISGSLGFAAAADGWLILRRVPRVKDAGLLRGKGRDLEDVDYALSWDRAIGTWSIVGDAEEVTATRELRETKRILTEFGKPMTPGQFATAAGVTFDVGRKRLYRYALGGEISSLSDGKYYVSLHPLSHLSHSSQEPRVDDRTPETDGTPVTHGTGGTTASTFVNCRGCGRGLRGTEEAAGYCRRCIEEGADVFSDPV